MVTVKEKLVDYLVKNGIDYEGIDHPPAASAEDYHRTVGTDYEEQAKALFIRYKGFNKKGYVVVAIQAHKKLELETIKNILDANKVRLASPEELKLVTGCSFGELPPFGKLFGITLLMDEDLRSRDKIYFNAGDLKYSIAMSPEDLIKLESPILF